MNLYKVNHMFDSTYSEDPLLKIIGINGVWQLRAFIILSLVGIPKAWNIFAISFFAPKEVTSYCDKPEIFQNQSLIHWINYAIPNSIKNGSDKIDECRMYDRDYSTVPSDWNTSSSTMDNLNLISCKTWTYSDNSTVRYAYNLSRFSNTLINQFDLACDRKSLVTHAQSTYMIGILFGALIGGICADRYGRRKVLLTFLIIYMVFGILTVFSNSIYMFIVFRFGVSFSTVAIFTVAFVYVIESVGEMWRAIYGISFKFTFSIGFMTLPILAYYINSWHYLQLTIVVLAIPLLIYFVLIPESPRWLVSKDKTEEASEIINNICRINRLPRNINYELFNLVDPNIGSANIFSLFKTPNIRKQTLTFYYMWFVNSLVYYGLSLNSDNLGGDLFVNNFVAGLVEIPAYIISIFFLIYCGRKLPLCITMVIGGLACLATMMFEKDYYTLDWPIVTLAMIGKFCETASFAIVYVYSAEVFPTVVRTTGIGSCSMFARFGSILAPYISNFGGNIYKHFPVICFGLTSILAGLMVYRLPETKGKCLPNTIEEGEMFGGNYEMNLKEDKTHKI